MIVEDRQELRTGVTRMSCVSKPGGYNAIAPHRPRSGGDAAITTRRILIGEVRGEEATDLQALNTRLSRWHPVQQSTRAQQRKLSHVVRAPGWCRRSVGAVRHQIGEAVQMVVPWTAATVPAWSRI